MHIFPTDSLEEGYDGEFYSCNFSGWRRDPHEIGYSQGPHKFGKPMLAYVIEAARAGPNKS